MEFELVPVRGQKFDVGRTINPFVCDCFPCTFLNCPKKNYAVQMRRKIPSFEEFWESWKEAIIAINPITQIDYNFPRMHHLHLTYSLINEMMECISFPKGTYWAHGDLAYAFMLKDYPIEQQEYNTIRLVRFNRNGREVDVGIVNVWRGVFEDVDLSKNQRNLAEKISLFIRKIRTALFAHYGEEYKDHLKGWLSPEGRHYICRSVEHEELARRLGYSEMGLEDEGWLKLPSEDVSLGWFGRHHPTAEQRNFLSMHGYDVESYIVL